MRKRVYEIIEPSRNGDKPSLAYYIFMLKYKYGNGYLLNDTKCFGILTALIMFNAEPHVNPVTGATVFEDFFDALYWATVTLTTVGYGDLTPVTDIGRLVSMLSSLFGVAIIALPSGVITASYLEELRAQRGSNDEIEE